MKRQDPESVGDVLRQALQEQGMTDRLYETKAIGMWRSIVGDEIADLTSRPSVYSGMMTIHVRTAPLRQELNMSRSVLKRLINEALGREAIKEIYFK